MPQWKYINGGENFNIIKFESFLIDLKTLNKKFNLNIKASFRKRGQKDAKTFKDFFKTRETTDRVTRLYERDFQTFDYPKA